MRFRLFGTRSFWLGVPGLVFLLWGWWVSMGHWSAAGLGGARVWGIGQIGGEVFAMWNSEGGPEWGSFLAEHDEMSELQARAWRETIRRENDPTYRYVFILYPWVVLAYVAGWAGLIVWRSRKHRALRARTSAE